MIGPGRLVRTEIDLRLFGKNYSSVRSLLKSSTKLMVVVKGNAYGHGIVPIAKKAEGLGADYFGVVCLHEARLLRNAGIKKPILLLNYTDIDGLDEALDLELSLNVVDHDVLYALSRKAGERKKQALVHVKIDSGMHRLGVTPDDAVSFINTVSQTQSIVLEGIFTHFASADEDDLSFTYQQLSIFKKIVGSLRKLGITPPLIHAANSAATLRVPESHFSMVRPGKILYGPLPSVSYALPFVSKPIMSLKTQIVQIRQIQKGEIVGYGRTFVAKRNTRIAAIPVGYADGFRRAPKNFGEVLVKGKRAPLAGRVSMDQSSIDISHIKNVRVGDEVVIIGKQGKDEISAEDVMEKIGTISYEVTTSLTERVTRVYRR